MNNKEFGKQMEERTKRFAISIITVSSAFTKTSEGLVIKNQLTKSGTSIGANYREANRSKSQADFKNKIKICEGEASETIYWLEIIESLNRIETNTLKPIMDEANELLAIFTSISQHLKP
ncbi:MAG TPA: four helix bundle protein [Marinilabiliales bacterium]|nr:four helix bundle protein [Marinilabiliales bacterium]